MQPQQPPQQMPQPLGDAHPMHRTTAALEEQLFTALLLLVADRIDPEVLSAMFELDLNDPRLAESLWQHNQREYQKLVAKYHPDGAPKTLPNPNEPRPRMGNGKIDHTLEMTRAARALFEQGLRKGGR